MDRFLGELIVFLGERYGVFAVLFLTALVISFGFNIRHIIDYFKWRAQGKWQYKKLKSLSEHPIFVELKALQMHYLVPQNINTKCVLRKQIYIDYMTERIKCLEDGLEGFVRQDLERLPHRELYLAVRGVIEKANLESANNCVKRHIPQNVLDKMQEKTNDTWKSYRSQIKLYCHNEYLYQTNMERVCAVLDMIPSMLTHYMNILENALAEFNGEIKSLNYNGIVCRNCKSCVHTEFLDRMNDMLMHVGEHGDVENDNE